MGTNRAVRVYENENKCLSVLAARSLMPYHAEIHLHAPHLSLLFSISTGMSVQEVWMDGAAFQNLAAQERENEMRRRILEDQKKHLQKARPRRKKGEGPLLTGRVLSEERAVSAELSHFSPTNSSSRRG